MPPPLALLFCTIFVVFLLKLGHKQESEISRSVWIPTSWALVAFSKPLGIWIGRSDQGSMEAGSSLDRAFLAILLCVAIIVLSKRRFDWSITVRENAWLFLLLGLMLISITWSAMPYASFKRWTRELVAVFMALLILSEQNPRQALLSILRRASYILIPYSLLLIKYYPELGLQFGRWSGERMWVGVATQKNGLAILCAISALFLIWSLIERWRKHEAPVTKYQNHFEIFLIALALYLFMGPRRTPTYSATAATVFAAALVTLLGFYWMKKRGLTLGVNTLKLIIIIFTAYGTVTPFLGELSILDVSSALERDGTLTGRADIWAFLVPFALSTPLIGHGFGGFWTTDMRSLTSSHAHNGYLDVILNVGFLGLLLIIIFLLACCKKALHLSRYDFGMGILFVCYLIMAAVHNIAESTINSFTTSLTAIILFFSVSLPKVSHESPSGEPN